ncbi:GAF domain-containing protein [Kineococcus sp. SYSU DK004]|uniref:GAF domain-containing protein n=1 Tax=Kineococcus sp. SYSU DK004 TaxID=3383125 RepID=UPI003D7D582F
MPHHSLPAAPLTFERACAQVLDHLQRTVPLGYWAITRFDGERQVYLQVRDTAYGTAPGGSHPWEDSLCRRMVEGAPRVAPDVAAVPGYADAPVTRAFPIGAYVGVPLQDVDGGLFGTVCGLDPSARGAELEQHRPLVELLAALLTGLLRAERGERRTAELTRWALEGSAGRPLSRIANRRGWFDFLAEADAHHRAHGDPARVVVFALGDGDRVPGRPTPAAHERLVRRAADLLRREVREHDFVADLGGGQLGLVLTRVAPAVAELTVRRVHRALLAGGFRAACGSAQYSLAEGFAAAWARAEAAALLDAAVVPGAA